MSKNYMPVFVGFSVLAKPLVIRGCFEPCLGVVCGGCGDKHVWNLLLSKN
jgi:hypothetical protein